MGGVRFGVSCGAVSGTVSINVNKPSANRSGHGTVNKNGGGNTIGLGMCADVLQEFSPPVLMFAHMRTFFFAEAKKKERTKQLKWFRKTSEEACGHTSARLCTR